MSVLNTKQPLADYGYKILKNGFTPIPIRPNSKVPSLPNWSNFKTTTQHIKQWSSNGRGNAGIGILTASTPCVDIDVLDDDVACSVMEWCLNRFGRGIIKTGLAPKIGLLYRTEEPFNKVTSPSYISPDGKKHKVEILSRGQQTVCIGLHPDTEKPYRFNGKSDITNTRLEDLPLLSELDAHEIVEEFCDMVPSSWTVVSGSSKAGLHSTGDDDDDEFINLTPPCDLTTNELIEYMHHVPADDGEGYEGWWRMGAALWHQYGGSDEGFDIWHEWSQADVEGYNKTNEKKMRAKWKSFDWRTKKRKPRTFASVMKQVNDGIVDDVAPSLIDYYLDRFALLPNDRIVDLQGHARSQKDYGGLSKVGITYLRPDDTFRPPNSKKPHHMVERWLVRNDKTKAAGFEYGIGQEKIFIIDKANWVNMYIPPEFAETKETSELQLLYDHMDYLFPNNDDKKLFYQWMANRIQSPAKRVKFVPLHISKHHGTGRGFIADLMTHMVGFDNLQTAKMKEIAGEGQGQFNTFLNSAICVVHEVRESEKRFQVSDKVRDTLDGDFLKVTAKGRTAVMKRISCSFLMFSNHYDALTLTDDDRRMWVIKGPNHVKNEKYYNALYALLENPKFLMQAHSFFMNYDTSKFNRGRRAPNFSRMRDRLIVNTESNEDVAMMALIEDKPFKVATRHQIMEWSGLVFPESPIDAKSSKKILDNEGCTRLGRLRWDGNCNCMPVLIHGKELHRNDEVRAELYKTKEYIERLTAEQYEDLDTDISDLI